MDLIVNFILVTGIIISMVIIGLIFHKKKIELPQKILLVIFISIIMALLHYYALHNKIKWLALATFFAFNPLIFIVSPLLLMYIKSLFVLDETKFFGQHKLHFIPFILFFMFISIPLFYYHLTKKIIFSYFKWILDNEYLIQFQMVILLVYAVISLFYLKKYENLIKDNYSNLEDKEISWIRHLLLITLLIGLLDLGSTIYELLFGYLNWNVGLLTAVALAIAILYLAYRGVAQSKILIPTFTLKDESVKLEATEPMIEKDQILEDRLYRSLDEEKVFQNPELTLSKLAEQMETSNKKVSTLLNQQLKTSFYDLINKYRVEEVKRRLDSDEYENLTLLAISMDAGFNSKTSFNRIFKTYTGFTPSQYKKHKKPI